MAHPTACQAGQFMKGLVSSPGYCEGRSDRQIRQQLLCG